MNSDPTDLLTYHFFNLFKKTKQNTMATKSSGVILHADVLTTKATAKSLETNYNQPLLPLDSL